MIVLCLINRPNILFRIYIIYNKTSWVQETFVVSLHYISFWIVMAKGIELESINRLSVVSSMQIEQESEDTLNSQHSSNNLVGEQIQGIQQMSQYTLIQWFIAIYFDVIKCWCWLFIQTLSQVTNVKSTFTLIRLGFLYFAIEIIFSLEVALAVPILLKLKVPEA